MHTNLTTLTDANINDSQLLEKVVEAVHAAGTKLLEIYSTGCPSSYA